MPTTDAPAFYPEESLEAHGLTPDDFASAGCYCLALDTPDDANAFLEAWADEYDHDPPVSLPLAISYGHELLYVGATGCLRDRLHDHVAGDKRRVKLLAVCPPTGVEAIWRYDSFEDAEEKERSHAYGLSAAKPNAVCWVNGEVV